MVKSMVSCDFMKQVGPESRCCMKRLLDTYVKVKLLYTLNKVSIQIVFFLLLLSLLIR